MAEQTFFERAIVDGHAELTGEGRNVQAYGDAAYVSSNSWRSSPERLLHQKSRSRT